ncbi:protein of unknown function [Tissierella praeacuta DSM 18095]|uniref:DUF4349 domain-containing protein n=1 Tax=Tissierella praeacuta DSM 18095 TaxID=1123404 RepID=A0A1M4VIM8_9FIRM|nr:protein of unknown function [Tissierella praeacuta DSM 18095]SUO99121.1 Uncharacterised protein [Tissierella praeacuta]
MVKNKKLFFIVSLILSFSLIFSGCGAKNSESYDMATEDMAPTEQWREMDNNKNEESKGKYGATEPEKIITTISISMQTKEFVDTTNKLTAIIEKHKGYVENSNIFHNNYYNSTRPKYSEYTIRIPKENLNQFVIDLKEIGNIISENTSKVDITKQYKDTESRLKVLEIKEGRILDLLKKAEKMEDIIALEDQLSNIIYEKENLTANIIDMDDKVDYSTVQFQLEEVAKLIPSENIKTPFWTKIRNAFKNSMYFFTDNIENLIISFIYFLPYGLIIGVLVYLVWRFIKKKRNNIPKE